MNTTNEQNIAKSISRSARIVKTSVIGGFRYIAMRDEYLYYEVMVDSDGTVVGLNTEPVTA